MRTQNMIRAFLVERIPSLNKGEEAIFRGLLKVLCELDKDIELTIYSSDPDIDRQRYTPHAKVVGPSVLVLSPSIIYRITLGLYIFLHMLFLALYRLMGDFVYRIMRDEIWKAYVQADIVFVGHDNMMASRHFSPQYIGNILLSKGLGKKVVVCVGSIGPYEGIFSKWLARNLLGLVDLIVVREEMSQRWCQTIGLDTDRVHLTADLALLLDPCDSKRTRIICDHEQLSRGGGPLIGMTAVRGSVVYRQAFVGNAPNLTDDEKYNLHCRILAQLVDKLVEAMHARIVFVPHVIGPGLELDDRQVARDIRAQVTNKESVYLIEREYTAAELKGIIGCCDMFIGERTHSVISALSMGVPSIVISFPSDFRTYGIVGKMLGQEEWFYDIETMNVESLFALTEDCWRKRDVRHPEIRAQVQRAHARAYRFRDLLETMIRGEEI
jgi:colanic acid/amylovoran biosynthesis protein